MGIKDRGQGGPQDDESAVVAEEAIVQQTKPATDAVREAIVTAEEVVPVEAAALSADTYEPLPMPLFIPAAAEVVPAIGAVPIQADTNVEPARPEAVREAATSNAAANVGLSVLALGGLLAVLREQKNKRED